MPRETVCFSDGVLFTEPHSRPHLAAYSRSLWLQGVRRCGFSTQGLGVPVGSVARLLGEASGLWADFCPSPEHLSRNCVPSVPFDVLTCLLPGALPPRGHGGPPLVLGCCRVKWVPLTAGVRGHSLATLLILLG